MQRRLRTIIPAFLLLFFALQSASVTQAADCVIPDSGPWPSCATGGNAPTEPEACVIPSSGPWPPCATGGNTPTAPEACVIPSSGPWPSCATGGGAPATPIQPGAAVRPVKITNDKDSSVASMPIVEYGGNIYFARDAEGKFANIYQRTIWVADGASGSSYKLSIPTSEYVPMKQQAEHASIDVCGGVLYISNNDALWTVNQSGKLTKLVDRGLKFALVSGGKCLFTHHVLGGNQGDERSSAELWRSNGTTAGTLRIDNWAGDRDGALYDFADLGNGSFVFALGDWSRNLDTNGVWISDGFTVSRFSDGNHVIGVAGATVYVGSTAYRSATWQAYDLTGNLRADMTLPYPEVLGQLGNRLIFKSKSSDSQADEKFTLWISDGSQTGLTKLVDLANYAGVIEGREFKGRFYFGYDNNQGNGRTLWVTNGTAGNVQQIVASALDTVNSSPRNFVVAGDWLYFSAKNLSGTRDLWRTNGNSTTQLTDNLPISSGSDFSIALSGEIIYFGAYDSPYSAGAQRQLWRLKLTGQSGGEGGCSIPASGPWPPCATGGAKPAPSPTECVIPASGPWPACARRLNAS